MSLSVATPRRQARVGERLAEVAAPQPEVEKLFDYPQQFAEDIFDRIEHALRRRAADGEANAVVQTGRLFILPADDPQADAKTSLIPDLPGRYIGSSDMQMVAAHKADAYDETHLLSDRREGKYVLSYQTPGGWVAITKDILTEVLGEGRDVKIVGLPPVAAGVLKLMCPNLLVLPEQNVSLLLTSPGASVALTCVSSAARLRGSSPRR